MKLPVIIGVFLVALAFPIMLLSFLMSDHYDTDGKQFIIFLLFAVYMGGVLAAGIALIVRSINRQWEKEDKVNG